DDSSFTLDLKYPGQSITNNYYDSPAGALVTNFNAADVVIKRNRKVFSRYKRTPVTPLLKKKLARLPRGNQYLNVATNPREGSIYTSELIVAIFKKFGATFQNKVLFKRVEKRAKLVYHYHPGPDLMKIIRKMLKDSNNFIANQLFLTLSLKQGGGPANYKKSAKITAQFLVNKVGLKRKDFELYEGAGLSKNNRIELHAMLRIVNYFKPYKTLLPPLTQSRYPSLVKVGKRWNILAKSGTLKKVANLAGFLETKNHTWKPFVIMITHPKENRDEVMNLIGQKYY
ncbi:MAG: hypothetical protein GY786_13040, partial [Proteobacteria bacterium]|nr:hypothetical protein [Pseudomonadota bacterium]